MLQEEEKTWQESASIEQTFQETATRNAFSSFAAQLHGVTQFLESTSSQLSVIARRTEPFSPSKRISHPGPNYLAPLTVPSLINSRSTPPPQSASPISAPLSPLSPQEPLSLQSTLVIQPNTQVSLPRLSPSSNILSPIKISASNRVYNVLPLSPPASPNQPPPHTSHDLILPPTSAFSPSTYPLFTTVDCTWQYIFARITSPPELWLVYTPGSLGQYADIKSLWQEWEEGAYVKDIGRKPALRLIDARWGNLESQETHKRKLPSWRPRNDTKVCVLFNK